MHKKTRSVYLALLISSGLLVAILPGCESAHQTEAEDAAHAPTAPVVKVARRDLSNTLEIASEFRPFQEIEVHAKESGYVKRLYIDWGTHVRAGQLMAVLEIPELEEEFNATRRR